MFLSEEITDYLLLFPILYSVIIFSVLFLATIGLFLSGFVYPLFDGAAGVLLFGGRTNGLSSLPIDDSY